MSERDRIWVDVGVDDPDDDGILDVSVFAEPAADGGDVEFVRADLIREAVELMEADMDCSAYDKLKEVLGDE